jgi:hypothetical protein
MLNYIRHSSVVTTILFVMAIALPSVAQNTNVEGRFIQRNEQNAVNLGTNITSVQENEQIGIQDLDGTSGGRGSTSVTGDFIQDDRQSVGNIGDNIRSNQRNRSQGRQDLDGFSVGF